MSWADDAIGALSRGERTAIRPRGGSMKGRVPDGARVVLAPITAPLACEDVVLVKVEGRVYLHRIIEARPDRVLIGNNVGGVNGWARKADVYGIAIEVDGAPVLRSRGVLDIGVNLTHRQFDRDRDAVIARAKAAGVEQMIVTGTTLANSRQAVHLAAKEGLHATAGVHPHHAKDWTDATAREIEELARRPQMVAVGECGLDFDRSFSPHDAQERAFVAQLELAARLKKPVFLHERAASKRFGEIMAAHRASIVGGVVHCFTGTGEELDRWLELDLHIGITGWICDERRGRHLLELVPRIPINRLMIETDAPFLVPRTLPSPPSDRRNEPAFLPEVLATIARARREDPAALAVATTQTARALFGLL